MIFFNFEVSCLSFLVLILRLFYDTKTARPKKELQAFWLSLTIFEIYLTVFYLLALFRELHDEIVPFQPLFLKLIPNICRVLSIPSDPFQELLFGNPPLKSTSRWIFKISVVFFPQSLLHNDQKFWVKIQNCFKFHLAELIGFCNTMISQIMCVLRLSLFNFAS